MLTFSAFARLCSIPLAALGIAGLATGCGESSPPNAARGSHAGQGGRGATGKPLHTAGEGGESDGITGTNGGSAGSAGEGSSHRGGTGNVAHQGGTGNRSQQGGESGSDASGGEGGAGAGNGGAFGDGGVGGTTAGVGGTTAGVGGTTAGVGGTTAGVGGTITEGGLGGSLSTGGTAGGAGEASFDAGGAIGSGGTLASGGVSGMSGAGGSSGGGGAGGQHCNEGVVVLATAPEAWGLALDEGYVYFTANTQEGSVQRVPTSGGAAAMIAAGELFPYAVAASNGKVFWATLGDAPSHLIMADDTGDNSQEIATGESYGIFSLSADATNVYYSTNLNVVYTLPVAGGSAVKLSGGPFNSAIVDMVRRDENLYWTNQGVGVFQQTQPETAELKRADVAGMYAPTALVNRLDYPLFQVAVDADGVFFNDETAVYRTTLDGGTPTVALSLPSAPVGESALVDMASDGDHLFYTDGQALYRMAVAGSAPEVVADGFEAIQALALDDTSIYFTDRKLGQVLKVDKCAHGVTAPGAGTPDQPSAAGTGGTAGTGGSDGQGGLGSAGGCGVQGCPAPTTVATIAHPRGLALDDSYLYFSVYEASGGVQRVSLAGGSPEPVVTGETNVHDIAVDDVNVYYCLNDTSSGHLAAVPKAGGTRVPLASGLYNAGVGRVTSDGAFAYFITGFNAVLRVRTTGGTATMIAAGPFNSNATDLAVAGTDVLWTNDGTWNSNYSGKVANTAFVGTTPVSGRSNLGHHALTSALTYPLQRIALDASNVYFVDGTNVYRQPRAGGSAVVLAPIAPAPAGQIVDMLSDGTDVYFADSHAVYRVPVTGGSVETLTGGWSSLMAIGVDASNLYFTDYGGGLVLKRPK
jgi:hypothetical protein